MEEKDLPRLQKGEPLIYSFCDLQLLKTGTPISREDMTEDEECYYHAISITDPKYLKCVGYDWIGKKARAFEVQ